MATKKKTKNKKVKNVRGTGKCPRPNKSFIDLWEKKSGRKIPKECRILKCKRSPKDGAHIKFSRDKKVYILPMCKMHNNANNTRWMVTNKDGLAVVAPKCKLGK